ncbi:hypothetical protein NPIL_463881, partial [Nephila pilipes]
FSVSRGLSEPPEAEEKHNENSEKCDESNNISFLDRGDIGGSLTESERKIIL